MEENNSISQILSVVLMVLVVLLFVLGIVYIFLVLKNRAKEKVEKDKKKIPAKKVQEDKKKKAKKRVTAPYSKQSIFDFMEFDGIQDNMIIQKNGRRFLVVVECLGVNYDLMSRIEKNAVEEGFQQFLNTLRHPIQIYIQTRTMNLGKSIDTYKEKVKVVEDKYNKIKREYARMKESMAYSEEDLNKAYFELTRCRNLTEYGKDIIANTERMSLNKNVLTKKYYIVIPYFPEETEQYDKEEIRNMAFAELYTKAQSILSTLSACSVSGKVLNSNELVELLYMAYNRDEAEIFGVENAMKAGYDSLYSTAPDVFEKKLRILDQEIQEQAEIAANRAIEKAKSKVQQKAEEKEDDLDFLVNKMAEIVVNNNKKYVGKDIADEALKILKEEGGNSNVVEEETKPRRRIRKQK